MAIYTEAQIRPYEQLAAARPGTPEGRRAAGQAKAMRQANAAQEQERQRKAAAKAEEKKAADAAEQRSATAALQAQLDVFGLGSLAPSRWQQWLAGVPVEQIVAGLRDTDEYKARFPGLDKMRKEGRGITEGQWVQYEQTARGIMRANGLPESFYDQPSDFAEMIDKGVDAQELEQRIGAASAVVTVLPQSVRDAAVTEGMSLGDLTALWLDPDVAMPVIEQKVARWKLQGAAADAGFSGLTAGTADALASRGMDYGEAKQAFDQAAALTPLTQQQVGERGAVSRDDVVAGVVAGSAGAKRRVQKRAEDVASRSVQGGGYAGAAGGIGGLGSSSR